MKFKDIAKFSASNLAHRGMRSWLTVLGIVIGVAAVMSIMSLGQGMQNSFSQQIGDLNSRIVTIEAGQSQSGFGPPGGSSGSSSEDSPKLGQITLQTVKATPGVEYVNGIVSGNAELTYLTEDSSVSVQGVDALAWKEMTDATLQKGRWLSSSDSNSIMITQGLAEDTFDREINLNSQVTIEGKTFKVVGIVESSSSGFGFGGGGGTVYMSSSSARTVLDTELSSNQYSSIEAYVAEDASINDTVNEITDRLVLARHVTDDTKDFTVQSEQSQSQQNSISDLTQTLNLFLTGIAGISLLVGAIGIANTMYMSVMERTKQIGTLKALGTTNREVMQIFMFESATIGLAGGTIGVFLGLIVSGLITNVGVSLLPMQGSITPVVTPQLVAFSLGFAVVIGMISGIMPARKAAKLQPVEALREE